MQFSFFECSVKFTLKDLTVLYPINQKKIQQLSTLWINYDPMTVHFQHLYLREHKWTSTALSVLSILTFLNDAICAHVGMKAVHDVHVCRG